MESLWINLSDWFSAPGSDLWKGLHAVRRAVHLLMDGQLVLVFSGTGSVFKSCSLVSALVCLAEVHLNSSCSGMSRGVGTGALLKRWTCTNTRASRLFCWESLPRCAKSATLIDMNITVKRNDACCAIQLAACCLIVESKEELMCF